MTATPKPTYEELLTEVTSLKAELAQLRRFIFGSKRERFVAAAAAHQLQIELQDDRQNQVAGPLTTLTYTRRQKKSSSVKLPSRNLLPAHLRREEIRLEPESDVQALKKIGDEITEELEYQPGELYVKRYVRPKYARPDGEGIIVASLPTRPIDKGIAGPGLLAQILISKYVDHLPLYRQRQQFRRHGVEIAESTLNGWVKASGELLLP